MYTNEVIIQYAEPRTTTIVLETKEIMSDVELEDLAMDEFEENFPDAEDVEVVEVRHDVRS